MDIARSCYEVMMKFPVATPNNPQRIRWFFTDKPPLPFPTVYYSHNWSTRPANGMGQVSNRLNWVNGSKPGLPLRKSFFGDQDAWRGTVAEEKQPASDQILPPGEKSYPNEGWQALEGGFAVLVDFAAWCLFYPDGILCLQGESSIAFETLVIGDVALEGEGNISWNEPGELELEGSFESQEMSFEGELELEGSFESQIAEMEGELELEGEAQMQPLNMEGELNLEGEGALQPLDMEGGLEVQGEASVT